MKNKECAELILNFVPKAMRSLRSMAEKIPQSESITFTQFRMLGALSHGGGLSNAQLAEWLGISAPTTSRMIDLLVRKKLIKRETESSDRRQVQLSLTPRASEMVKKLRKQLQDDLAQQFASLGDSKLEKLYEGLQIATSVF